MKKNFQIGATVFALKLDKGKVQGPNLFMGTE